MNQRTEPAPGAGARGTYERDATIEAVFEARAAQTPAAPAVVAGALCRSYAELESRANRLANLLRALGVGPERTVAVALERSVDLPAVLLAILKAGGAYVPLDLSYPRERLAFILEDAAVSLVLCAGGSGSRLPDGPARRLDLEDAAAAIAAQSDRKPAPAPSARRLAYVMYTSGSTGRPKGVAIEHRGVVRLVRNTDYLEVRPDDVFFQFAPPAFDASTFEIWGALLNGACLAVPEAGPLSMSELTQSLRRHRVTTLWLTAPLFRLAVDTELNGLAGLRTLLTGGDVVSPQHARRFLEAFPACALINGYGPTENTTFSCCYRVPSAASIGTALPIGVPIAHSSAYVLDRDLRPVTPGASGELCVGGDGLARGYLNLPELTAERFVPDPFAAEPEARLYRTGDLVRLRPDGLLDFLGRLDHQVKVRGYRIELEEVEAVLRADAGVADAAVGVVSHDGEKALFAHVVAARAGVDERYVRRLLAAKLPAYAVPTHVAVAADLPRTASGKLDRRKLAERAATALSGAASADTTNRPF